MKNLHILITSIAAVAAFTQRISAETLLVPEQYSDIQSAVNAANDGDEILVGPGEYDQFQVGGYPYENQHPVNLSISSTDGPEATVLRRNPSGPQAHAIGVIVGQGVVAVSGFTIDSFGSSYVGGPGYVSAIYVFGGSASFENMKVTNCNGVNPGTTGESDYIAYGGSYKNTEFLNCRVANSTICRNETELLESCRFVECEGLMTYGFNLSNDTTHVNCVFENCDPSPNVGNGWMFYYGEYEGCQFLNNRYRNHLIQYPKRLQNCTFSDNTHVNNTSDGVSPVFLGDVTAYVDNCSFDGNTGRKGGAVYQGSNNTSYVTNSIFTNNEAFLIGGAIFSGSNSTMYLTGSTICDNFPNNISGNVSDQGSNSISPSCIPIGSCCFPTGCISDVSDANCIGAGGVFSEELCDRLSCEKGVGACCTPSGCLEVSIETCFDLGGNYAGFGTDCASTICESNCEGDISGNGDVGLTDLIAVLRNWGPCP